MFTPFGYDVAKGPREVPPSGMRSHAPPHGPTAIILSFHVKRSPHVPAGLLPERAG
jgi:hypothetical protein